MSAIEIKDRDDLRVGDTATFTYRDRDHVEHEFTGPLWILEKGTLFIGRTRVYDPHGGWTHAIDFVRATRVVPDLPTEPGAVILVTECRGERLRKPIAAILGNEGDWVTPARPVGRSGCLLPEHITEWTPAKVVPA